MTETTPEETPVDPILGTQEPIDDTPKETVTETVALEEDGDITPIPDGVEEVITRDGGTSVSAAFRVAAGLDPAGE